MNDLHSTGNYERRLSANERLRQKKMRELAEVRVKQEYVEAWEEEQKFLENYTKKRELTKQGVPLEEVNEQLDKGVAEVVEAIETIDDKPQKENKYNRFKKIQDNTSKIKETKFVSTVKNENKTMLYIIIGAMAVILSLIFSLKANNYWYQEYGQYLQPTTQVEGFGVVTTTKPEPEIMTCLMQGMMLEGFDLDLSHISAKVFAGSFGIMLGVVGVIFLLMWTTQTTNKQMRVGSEHGNRHLASKSEIKKYQKRYMETDNYNILFSKNTGLSLNNKKTNRSANVLVIGGTGTGKSFKYVNPNLLQENASNVITDPSGDLFRKFAPYLMDKGYNVWVFNVNDFNKSSYYNPLLNVYDGKGQISEVKVDILVDLYMKNAKAGKEAGGSDPFWDKAEKAFLTATIYYVLENDDIELEDKCFYTVLEKVQLAKAEVTNGKQSSETILTKEINAWKMECQAQGRKIKTPIYYDTFLIAPEKTANTILITTAVDLQIFATEEVNKITRYNTRFPESNIDFDLFAQTPSYLFLCIPSSHQAYNFLISMLYSQMYGRLYDLGETVFVNKYLIGYRPEIPQFNLFDDLDELEDFVNNVDESCIKENEFLNNKKIYHLIYKGKEYKRAFKREAIEQLVKDLDKMVYKRNTNTPELPIHINFLLDEFKNIGEIPNFLTILSTSRKYRIGSHPIIQDIGQIKTMYPDGEHETLLANVDTTIFLGSIMTEDKEYIQKMLGKTTIKVKSSSSSQGGGSTTYTPTEVDLVSLDQLSKINEDGHDDCVVMVRDCLPVIERKLLLFEHPKYKDFENAKNNTFKDAEQYFRTDGNVLEQNL